jgi:hypothetical protein
VVLPAGACLGKSMQRFCVELYRMCNGNVLIRVLLIILVYYAVLFVFALSLTHSGSVSLPPVETSCVQLFQCLSRACLGKYSACGAKWHQKALEAFPHLLPVPPHRRQGPAPARLGGARCGQVAAHHRALVDSLIRGLMFCFATVAIQSSSW